MNCYILVGGRSSRMGLSKTELFLDRILAAVRPVFDEVLAVHRSDGEPLPLRTLFEEPHEGDGPLFGIERALQDAHGKAFIVGVDFPLVTSEVLGHLSDRFEKSAAPALVPMWDGKPQPLCAGYDSSLLPLIAGRLARGEWDVRGCLDEGGAEIVPEPELRARFEGEPLMNVNTPEELRRAEESYGT